MSSDSSDDKTAVRSGTRGAAPSDTQIEIPGYRIERRLGEGGMGAVYLAEEVALGRNVAIKVVSDRIARDAESRARFLREARLLATVEHPNVVRVYTFGSVGERPYLVMEYVEGETLSDRIRRDGPFSVDAALAILRQVVDALASAWEKRVIHRDIKPSNILFDARGRLKVADFGLAKGVDAPAGDSSLTQTGYLLGSPHYVAPEQAQGHDADFRSDIYSLGIMLYEMLAARKPFDAASALAIVAKHLHESLPPIRAIRKDISKNVEALIGWMTEKNPQRRPGSYTALLGALAGESSGDSATMPLVPPGRSRPWLAAALALAAIALAGSLAWRRIGREAPAQTQADRRIVIAVAPFYGPEAESAREGRVMASLVEREIARRMRDDVKVLGVEETKEPVRNIDAARTAGERLGASLMIWGNAYVFGGETEIQPSITVIPRKGASATPAATAIDAVLDVASVRVGKTGPNEIELRKTSAEGIGELVVFAVAAHLLEQNDASRAFVLLSELRPTPDSHQQKALALVAMDREADAIAELQKALALDSAHAASRATLSDIAIRAGRYREAAQHLTGVAPGKHFTAAEGVLLNGKLYTGEYFEGSAGFERAPVLRVIDPATERVVERHWLPGIPVAFRAEEEAVVIRYTSGFNANRVDTIRFAGGRFTPARHLPDELIARVRSQRAGWRVAGEFLNDVATPQSLNLPRPKFRYVAWEKPRPNGPTTLKALREELAREIERDPTQPWLVLHLALTHAELGDRADAERYARQALSDAYPGTPYYDYAWMARHLESLGHRAWADLAYVQAKRRRAMHPQPVGSALLLERLIAAPFVRGVAALSRWSPDPPRHFEWFLRAQSLGGVMYEADATAAQLWQRYFETNGDAERARRAAEAVRASQGPNVSKWTALADLCIAAIDAVSIVFAALLILSLIRARRTRIGVSRSARSALIALLAADVLLILLITHADRSIRPLTVLPAGMADAIHAPAVREELERHYAQAPSPELASITAAAQHLAGNLSRARELYSLAGGSTAAGENLLDLQRGKPPRHVPTEADVHRELARVPFSQAWRDLGSAFRREPLENEWDERVRKDATWLFLGLAVLAALCAWFVYTPVRDDEPRSTLRHAFGAVLVLFVVLVYARYHAASTEAGQPTAGMITAKFQTNYASVYPLPPIGTYEERQRLMTTMLPSTRIVRWSMLVAALLAVALLAPSVRSFAGILSRKHHQK